MMLFKLYYGEEGFVYVTEEEYDSMRTVFNYLNVPYKVTLVQEKMYRIKWYDDIDEEWNDIWCTEDNYPDMLKEVKLAEVEYEVVEFN